MKIKKYRQALNDSFGEILVAWGRAGRLIWDEPDVTKIKIELMEPDLQRIEAAAHLIEKLEAPEGTKYWRADVIAKASARLFALSVKNTREFCASPGTLPYTHATVPLEQGRQKYKQLQSAL